MGGHPQGPGEAGAHCAQPQPDFGRAPGGDDRQAYPNDQLFISPLEALQSATERSLLIVVDTHSVNFVESRELLERVPRVVVIDHHRMMVTHIKNALIFYHEPYASSASEMVTELAQYIKACIDCP